MNNGSWSLPCRGAFESDFVHLWTLSVSGFKRNRDFLYGKTGIFNTHNETISYLDSLTSLSHSNPSIPTPARQFLAA